MCCLDSAVGVIDIDCENSVPPAQPMKISPSLSEPADAFLCNKILPTLSCSAEILYFLQTQKYIQLFFLHDRMDEEW